MTEEIEPHVMRKFEILQKLGKGAYGIVWKAVDKKLKQVVALKKVFDAFHNATDAQRTFREVQFLQELNGHENIIRLLNVIKAHNHKDLYLVFDFMETDLHAVIRANILEEIHKQYIIYQILKALKYIHSGELIHRDLKPANVLLNDQCHVKLADFGLARSVANCEEEVVRTEYVATRWYRAPEILLGSTKYTKPVDMWSVGCMLGELIIGKAIFPGTSTLNQIEKIIELLGKPKAEDIESIESPLAWNILGSINTSKKKTFQGFFQGASESALDLLRKLLSFNPKKRPTAEEALCHKYVEQFANKAEETICDQAIKISLDDDKKLGIKEYRDALYNDIQARKKTQRRKWQQQYLAQLGISQQMIENSLPTESRTNLIQDPPASGPITNEPTPANASKKPVKGDAPTPHHVKTDSSQYSNKPLPAQTTSNVIKSEASAPAHQAQHSRHGSSGGVYTQYDQKALTANQNATNTSKEEGKTRESREAFPAKPTTAKPFQAMNHVRKTSGEPTGHSNYAKRASQNQNTLNAQPSIAKAPPAYTRANSNTGSSLGQVATGGGYKTIYQTSSGSQKPSSEQIGSSIPASQVYSQLKGNGLRPAGTNQKTGNNPIATKFTSIIKK